MPSNPSFQFYPADWTRDTIALTAQARGCWIDLLCAMHWNSKRGQLTGDINFYARLFRLPVQDTLAVISEFIESNTLQVTVQNGTLENGKVTLLSRRITKEEYTRKLGRYRKERYTVTQKERKSNAPSSSSSSNTNTRSFIYSPVDKSIKHLNKKKITCELVESVVQSIKKMPEIESTAEKVNKRRQFLMQQAASLARREA